MNFDNLPINTDSLIGLGINAISALLIAVIALWISSKVDGRIRSLPGRVARFDPMVAGFLASLARYGILAVAATFILSRLGIQATSLAAILGAAGLAIGLALQGTLSNMAAGVMIVIFRPFQLGNYITAGGHSGTVSNITLFFTELTTPDNQGIIIPNSDMWSKPIVNSSAHPTRRCDLVFSVSYDTDLDKAEACIRRVVDAEERVLSDPEYFLKVTQLGPSSVDFTLRAWVESADLWDVKFALTRAIKEGLDAEGIEIPFPTRKLIQVQE
jgi:small conductance mechanosensitive channel